MLWHRWHPGGLSPQPAHCATLRPHQFRPGGHARGQVRPPLPTRGGSPAGPLPIHISGSPGPAETHTKCPGPWGGGREGLAGSPPTHTLHPRSAATVQDGSQYSVLLIITDGVISDMAQTKEAIVNVSRAGHRQGKGSEEVGRAWAWLLLLPSSGPPSNPPSGSGARQGREWLWVEECCGESLTHLSAP